MRREGSDILVLIVEDCTGRKIFKMKSQLNDDKGIESIFNSIIGKYSLGLKIVEQPVQELKEETEFKW